MTVIKRGFLSLEYIIGNKTYWLTSGLGRDSLTFTELDRDLFNCELLPNQLWNDSPYSEITAYEHFENHPSYVFLPNCDKPSESIGLVSNLEEAPFFRWNELAHKLLNEGVHPSTIIGLWKPPMGMMGNIVQANLSCKSQSSKKDVNYMVTAFLPPAEGEGIFGLFGEDWSPENPNAITHKNDKIEVFVEVLKWYDIKAVRWGNEWIGV